MFLFLQFLISLFLAIMYINAPREMNVPYLVQVLLADAMTFALLYICKVYSLRNFFRISAIFILVYGIVHFQAYLDFCLGNIPISHWFIWRDNSVVCKSAAISGLGLSAFAIGNYIILKKKKIPVLSKYDGSYLSSEVVSLLFYAVIFLVYLITTDKSYFIGGAGHGRVGPNGYVQNLLDGCVIICFCQSFWNNAHKDRRSIKKYFGGFNKVFLGLTSLYFILVLSSGDRSQMVAIILLFISGYIYTTGKNLSFIYILFLFVLIAPTLSLIGKIRGFERGETSVIAKISDYSLGKDDFGIEQYPSIMPSTSNYASIVRGLHLTVSYTDSNGYWYGRMTFNEATALVPFLNRLLGHIVHRDELESMVSAPFVTYLSQGTNVRYGEGTTCLVSLWLDGGILGVIVGMFLAGVFFGICDNIFENPNYFSPLVYIIVFTVIAGVVVIPRSSFGLLAKSIISTVLLFLIIKMIPAKNERLRIR
jgi:hypothetical protein